MDWTMLLTSITAIAAAAAAGAAAWQAYETRKQVNESRKQGEVARAQFLQARYDDARPMLIIVSSPQSIPVEQGNVSYLDWIGHQLPVIEVRNVGNGPALSIRSVIYGPKARAFADPSTMLGVIDNVPGSVTWKYLDDTKEEEEREKHWYHWATDVVGQGEQRELKYTFAGVYSPNTFSEANKSIESKDHTYKYAFNAPKQPLSSPNYSIEPWCIGRVTITYHDIFHHKHASIYDLVYRQKWQEVAFVDDITSDLDDLLK